MFIAVVLAELLQWIYMVHSEEAAEAHSVYNAASLV